MSYNGLTAVSDPSNAHVGGNIFEGDPYTFSPLSWDYLVKRFGIQSVLDLGSGMGYAARYFSRLGLDCLAVDGMLENCVSAVYPTIQLDLTHNRVNCRVDLVHCQEVVEHIDCQFIDNLLSSLCCGRYIVMTHAFPGQGGYHHVNEQPPEYWINNLRNYNCELLEEDTARVRRLAVLDGAAYLSKSALVFVNKNYR